MSLRLPPPQSLFSLFFTSLVSSVRNPITVIKSADPQRALLQTAGEGGRHGGGEIWLEGKRWMERAQRLQREMMERRRDEGVNESVEEEEAEQTYFTAQEKKTEQKHTTQL